MPSLALVPGDPRALDGPAGGGRVAAAFVLGAAGLLSLCGCGGVLGRPCAARELTPNLVKVRKAVDI